MASQVQFAQAIEAIATLIERDDFTGAQRYAQSALTRLPPHAEIWRLLAIAQLKSGNTDAALRSLQQALALDPTSIDVLCNLASVQTMCGNPEQARRALEQALALDPDHAAALNNLGRLLHESGDFAGAVTRFERSARAQPGYVPAWLSLASAQLAQFNFAGAEANIRHALTLDARSTDAWYALGYVCERQGKLRDANAAYRASMQIQARPRTAYNLALVLDQLNDWRGAAQLLEHALQLDPNLHEAAAQLLFVKRRLCDWTGLDALAARVIAAVDARASGITPFSFLAEDATPAQQLACARTFARQFAVRRTDDDGGSGLRAASPRDAPVRVGFVSSGFAEHATGLLVVELIELLRATNLVTLGFATTAGDGSEIRRRIEAGFDHFFDLSARSADAIATTIHSAHCDILLDIDGYCMGSTPQVFALRPAPLQINWLAYPGSLGAPWYDYLIADEFLIPPQQRAHYDEKIAWLPRCYQPTDATRIVRAPPRRSDCGLPASGFVYCCFNNTWKFSPRSFALWMQILHRVPGSVLWLLDGAPGSGVADRLRAAARMVEIDPERLIFSPKLGHAEYLARYRNADLFLDTDPYNAHTTASDALYAGCPVLTCPGDTFASRVAGSLNRQLGLDEMTVADDAAYVERAVELATLPLQLRALRAKLADAACRARLFDMRAYAIDFALLLTRIAERARRGELPDDISLN